MLQLSDSDVVLLDVNGTFMFGGDRFGGDQDYPATYKVFGGRNLSDEMVEAIVTAAHAELAVLYDDPEFLNCFPTVNNVLRELDEACGLTDHDYDQLTDMIAHHEIGHVPTEYATALKRLADHFLLGLVTNIWSAKTLWLRELERAGIDHLFRTMIFSSDSSSIKPSPKLFREALEHLGCDASGVVFVGDDLSRDMEGAKALGLRTVWISSSGLKPSCVDITIPENTG